MRHLVEKLDRVGNGGPASVRDLLDAARQASLHALALVPALMVVTPLSAIPGLSAVGGIIIFLICAQQVIGRNRLWLPETLLKRELERASLDRFTGIATKIAGFLDRIFRPRLTLLVHPPVPAIINGFCAILGLCMPFLEVIPTSSSILAAIVVLLQLALMTRDGLLLLAALAVLGSVPFAITTLLAAVA